MQVKLVPEIRRQQLSRDFKRGLRPPMSILVLSQRRWPICSNGENIRWVDNANWSLPLVHLVESAVLGSWWRAIAGTEALVTEAMTSFDVTRNHVLGDGVRETVFHSDDLLEALP